MRIARRIEHVPPYLFAEIDRKKAEVQARGVEVISLGIGDPDQPTPEHIVKTLQAEAAVPAHHRYPAYEGSPEYRRAVATYYKKRFGVDLDPEREVTALIGSKEGIGHIFLAFVDPGDYTLIPDPGYPVYRTGTIFAGGIPHLMPLRAENGFFPDLGAVDPEAARKARLMFLNYPNNPTGAVAGPAQLQKAVDFCRERGIVLCHDAAYLEFTYDGYRQPSLLEIDGSMEVGLEFGSLSKPYNMTGWRIAYAVGNADAVSALRIIKTNLDSGQFTAIERAAVAALEGSQEPVEGMRNLYKERRDLVIDALRKVGLQVDPPAGSFYVWAPVPPGRTSTEFATRLLEETGVLVVPGVGYGEAGEGYFRISLTIDTSRLREAMARVVERFKV
ncbi:MAG: LL-diaminopimelate aminotransferase [Firmicutes bacterium]|nr:LL-diaminopimelate aminotransferase [Bacillota bacterium]